MIPDFIYVKDLESRFLLNNLASMRGFGKTQEELLTKTDYDVLPTERAAEHYASEQAIMQSGEALIQHEELTFERRSGRELWMSTTKVPLRDSQGQVTGLVGISRDITERKQSEEARARLAAIVQSSNDAIIGETVERIITSWNLGAERIFGYRADEAIGQSMSMLVPPDHADEFPYILSAIQRDEPLEHFETVRLRKDGQRIDVSLTVSPIRDSSGALVGASVIARDITERKLAEGHRIQLELERTKLEVFKRFVGDVSHDLRTPLSIMTTSLYLLRKGLDSERLLRYIENLEEQTGHMQKIVEDLFTLSRLEMAEAEFRLTPGNLNTLVRIVCEKEQRLAEQKNHQISLRLAEDLPPVALDQQEFSVALDHLLVNALNYTPDGGQIAVSTYLDQEKVVLEVRDSGIGISDEDTPHIFERFYRVDKARAINTGGFGLGLPITRRIVEVHSGQIEVESAVGAGTVFRVRLPALAE
jgi:PAS domain S-box-containing protein